VGYSLQLFEDLTQEVQLESIPPCSIRLTRLKTTTMRNLAGPQMPWKRDSKRRCERHDEKSKTPKNQTRRKGGFDF